LVVVHVQLEQLLGNVQVALQVRDWHAPQPVVVVVPAAHTPSPVHGAKLSQLHEVLHWRVCVPQLPHGCVCIVPAAHAPSPMHAPNAPQVHCAVQRRD
jgi:hypothetical protein